MSLPHTYLITFLGRYNVNPIVSTLLVSVMCMMQFIFGLAVFMTVPYLWALYPTVFTIVIFTAFFIGVCAMIHYTYYDDTEED